MMRSATLDVALGKLPDDPLLSGVKMALQIGMLGISPSDQRFATLLKKLPPGGAAGALTVALSQLSRQAPATGSKNSPQ